MLLLTDPNFQELVSIPVLCADIDKSRKQYEKYWVVEIVHYKERSLVGKYLDHMVRRITQP
jgi:hypothetical protein